MKKKALKNEAMRLVELWKPRLHLQEWRVKVRWAELEDDALALVETEKRRHVAVIWIHKYKSWHNFFDKTELEEVIVHELAHLYFVLIQPSSYAHELEEVALEQSVNKITQAFLAAYKNKEA